MEASDRERQEGIHASDLLDPLLAYWQRQNRREISERQVWFYQIGRILHALVLMPMSATKTAATDSGTREELGILFSPDHHEEEHPVELKTHRGTKEPTDDTIREEFHHYLEQLLIYMVLENCRSGELWVLFINLKDETGRTFPEPRCYNVTLSEAEFYKAEKEVFEARDLLKEAIEENDPSKLPLCRAWKCGSSCIYFDRECRPKGRWPERIKKNWTA